MSARCAGGRAAPAWALALHLFASGTTGGAVVTAMSGDTYQGRVDLDNGVIVTPDSGPAVKLDFNSVLDASLDDAGGGAANAIQPGLVLQNGTQLSGAFTILPEGTYRVAKRNLALPAAEVAWIVYQAFDKSVAEKVAPDATGVLLPGGDFFDGEVRSVDAESARILSPIFGLRTFSVKGKDALAVILRAPKPPATPFELRTTDGSLFPAEALAADRSGVSLRSPLLGTLKLDAKEIAEIRAGPSRVVALTKLKLTRIAGPAAQTAPPAFAIDHSVDAKPIVVWGESVPHGIAAGVGVAATWELPPGFSVLVARVALPAGTSAEANLAFAIYADNRQVFRSSAIDAREVPRPVHANVTGARTVSLRVEPAAPGLPAAGTGVWISPTLIRK